jgi:hypothetical protein
LLLFYNYIAIVFLLKITSLFHLSKVVGDSPVSKKQRGKIRFLAVIINFKVCFLLHLVEKTEIIIKQERKFLDLTNVPIELKLRSGLKNYLYIRDCYELIIADVCCELLASKRKHEFRDSWNCRHRQEFSLYFYTEVVA